MSAGSAGRRTSLRALHGITRCIRLCVHAGHCERGKLIIGAFNADGLVAVARLDPPANVYLQRAYVSQCDVHLKL